jgi:hypothetical protein
MASRHIRSETERDGRTYQYPVVAFGQAYLATKQRARQENRATAMSVFFGPSHLTAGGQINH